jgi:antitoxin VapB
MGIFIKRPETERKARELASLRGETLTAAIDHALEKTLQEERPAPRRRPSAQEVLAATDEFRRVSGLDKVPIRPMTKADWDDLWPTGIPEIDNS